MDLLTAFLQRFLDVVWATTDPFALAFAIVGTYVAKRADAVVHGEDPENKSERSPIQRVLPLIPVFLGMSWVLMYEISFGAGVNAGNLLQRAVGTGCSAIAVHKAWWHVVKNT